MTKKCSTGTTQMSIHTFHLQYISQFVKKTLILTVLIKLNFLLGMYVNRNLVFLLIC